MQGGDPLAAKREARAVITFAEATDLYLAAKLEEFKNEKHRVQWRSTLDSYAIPVLGRKLVADITVQDLLRVLEPIWTSKTVTATRVRQRIESVLSWAAVAGHRSGDNPARWKGNLSEILPKPSKVAKGENHPAVDLGDAARWWAELGRREGMAARALQFVALTGSRSGNVREMTWDEVHFRSSDKTDRAGSIAIWVVPASKMKNGREHRVPLAEDAIALLEALPRIEDSPLVFSAPRGGMLSDMSLSAVMRRMHEADEKAGGPGYRDPQTKRPAVPHGLRTTFRNWAAERGSERFPFVQHQRRRYGACWETRMEC
jgi:integrase